MTTRPARRPSPTSNGRSHGGQTAAQRNGSAPRRKTSAARVLLPPSRHSEATSEAFLQTHRGPTADRLTVNYSGGTVVIDLVAQGVSICQGVWEASVTVDGQPAHQVGDWEAVCWNADEDVDYLELQCDLDGGGRIDRQLVLSRRGGFALLADAILTPGAGQIDYRSRWSIGPGLRSREDTPTRAARLAGRKIAARLFPLALPALRQQAADGRLSIAGGALELIQSQAGAALYTPLALEWNPRRRGSSATWRTLTVSEAGRAVPLDVAAGYRLQVGRTQWLVYHGLQNHGAARAVLGHHTWNETVIGEIGSDGGLSPLILIE
ncbi:MAG: hypothetical protein ACKV0T_19255 [Planctomycetales bacterium]